MMITAQHWLRSILFASIVYPIFLIYGTIYTGSFSIGVISESLAGTAGILIGLSFALSGISYFFDFADRQVILRKYLGLTGYWLALAYSISLMLRFPELYQNFSVLLSSPEAVLGLGAISILTSMMLISNTTAMAALGMKLWRRWLRLGYLAYALLIWRAFLVEGERWASWWITMETVPPPRLLLTIFAIGVILLRLMMLADQVRTKRW